MGEAIHPAVVIDMSDAETGERTFSIGDRNVKLVRGVRLVRAIPSEVRFQFEPRRMHTVPVQVRFIGEGQNGYDGCGISCGPAGNGHHRAAQPRGAYHVGNRRPDRSFQQDGHFAISCERLHRRFLCAFSRYAGSGGHRDHEEKVGQGEVLGKELFGTDGIRGVAGEFPLDPVTVYAFGVALGKDAAARMPRIPRS